MSKVRKISVVAGIDAGTTKMACVAIDKRSGKIVYSKSIPANAYFALSDTYRKEQNLKKIEKVFDTLMAELFLHPDLNIISIGFTGQMHGIIGLDAKNKAVTNLVTWEDQSGNKEIKKGISLVQHISRKAPGLRVASGYGLVTLYKWIHLEKNRNIKKISNLPDYLAARLTGKYNHIIDPTFAHSIGAFDSNTGNWEKRILKSLDLNSSILPSVVPTGSVYGYVNSGYSKTKVPVSVSLGDNQASFSGSVRNASKSMLINIGTSAQICYLVPANEKKKIEKLIDGYDSELRPFDKKNFLCSVNLLNGGNTHRLLYDFFVACGRDLFGIRDLKKYEELWNNMQSLSISNRTVGIPCIEPLFNGLRSNPGVMGKISEITRSNFTPQNLITAFHRGMAEHYKSYVRVKKPILIGGGNGIRKNQSLLKEIERAFGQKLVLPDLHEEAAVGAALWFSQYKH